MRAYKLANFLFLHEVWTDSDKPNLNRNEIILSIVYSNKNREFN